jgi:1-acyl-sn-glycerol-3-phosphate acyltransferase
MSAAARLLYAAWAALWGAAVAALFSTLHLIGAPFAQGRAGWTSFTQRGCFRSLLFGLGVRVRVRGMENVPSGRSVILMANHRSYLDIPAVTSSFTGLAVLFVAKRELTRIPFLGWAIRFSQHIKVDRGNREQAVAALAEAVNKIRSGVGLAIFPEGTRSVDDRLLPFKKGGFYIAVESGLPIIPISIRNSGRLFGKKGGLPRPGTIEMIVHPPVSGAGRGKEAIPALVAEVRSRILSGLPESLAREKSSGGTAPAPPSSFSDRKGA